MTELRQNPATKEWVIIAAERARRPEELGVGACATSAEDQEKCPFCPGHEKMTPKEIMSYRTYGTQADAAGWWIRVIPNKFAALLPHGSHKRSKIDDFFLCMDGLGEHEVLIETPDHSKHIAIMDQKQVEEVFLAYRQRYEALSQDPRFEKVIIFKNHGARAGTSLSHSHSQIIAAPIMPLHIRNRLEEAMRYFDDNGSCVYCDMITKEKKLEERIVFETDNFVVLEPFAARTPFETWVLPKKHASAFDSISTDECKELAYVMRQTLIKIYRPLNNPDYNYMLYSSPCHERDLEYFHWHFKIVPRVAAVAGFELGSGIYINTMPPEIAAKYLREVPVE